MLGIGIFIAPPVVAQHIDRPGVFLIMWAVGGLSALFGALSVAELGAMMPRAGGDYPILRRSYGPGLAFAAGWLQLLAIFPGSLAAMAVGTGQFQLPIILGPYYELPTTLGIPGDPAFVWAIAIVVVLTGLNHLGVVMSGRLQVLLTGIPVVILLVASFTIFGGQGTDGGAWAEAGSRSFEAATPTGALALAFLPIYFAYSGWYAAIFVGGEVKNPSRNLPRSLIGGTVGVTILYLILCVGFLSVFSISDLANTGEAGTAAANTLFGTMGTFFVAELIVLAMLGSINGTILTGSRIAFAMAQHGHCIGAAGRLHPKRRTPVVALWMQAGWAVFLIATQSFEELVNYTSAAMLITGTLTVMAVVVLRRKMPDAERPYRTWGYPIAPLAYAASSILVLALLASDLDPSVFLSGGWFLLALGFHHFVIAPRTRTQDAEISVDPPPTEAATTQS